MANAVFASALCDPNGPKLTLSHCSLLTSLKLEGCYEDLSFGFFFSGLMEPRKERELLCPVVDGCKSPVLGWVCGCSSDPHQGAVMHWPPPECTCSCSGFFSTFFQLGWYHWDHNKDRLGNMGKGPFAQHPSLRDALGLTLVEPASSNGFTLDAFFSGLP